MKNSKITPRERVSLILNHKEADRVPMDIGGTIFTSLRYWALKKLSNYLKINSSYELYSEYSQVCSVDEEIKRKLHSDFRIVTLKNTGENSLKNIGGNRFRDNWGIVWKKEYLDNKEYTYVIDKSPLENAKSIDEILKYDLSDVENERMYKNLEEEASELRKSNYAVVGSYDLRSSIFGIFWFLRGFEKFFMDLIINEEFATVLMEKVMSIQEKIIVKFLEKTGKYLDVFCLCGDLGTQNSLLISPNIFRKMIKPLYVKIIKKAKNYTDAKIFYHSCGSVYHLIEDLIDCGIDILNPIQVSAKGMDTEKMKKEFGKRIVSWGGIDTQNVLSSGTVEDVYKEVKLRINHLAKGGGYVIAPVHNIQSDIPPQNIVAMYEAGYKYGKYTISC